MKPEFEELWQFHSYIHNSYVMFPPPLPTCTQEQDEIKLHEKEITSNEDAPHPCHLQVTKIESKHWEVDAINMKMYNKQVTLHATENTRQTVLIKVT